ncbi:MAG: hypothetical protein OXC15_00765 [Rhodospirillaceae bacterium]|nr:hypothetical protein [Rhodospirillaceae bacterium]
MALQILIQGFVLSGLYALIAVGFTMIFSVGRVLNLAYGVYIMLGGYIYYAALQGAGLPVFASFILAILAGRAPPLRPAPAGRGEGPPSIFRPGWVFFPPPAPAADGGAGRRPRPPVSPG